MRKITSLFLLALSLTFILTFTSCGDKEEESAFIAAELLGTWTSESVSFSITLNGQDLVDYLKSQGASQSQIDEIEEGFDELSSEFTGWAITFDTDNTYTSIYSEIIPPEGVWSLNEGTKELSLFEEVTTDEFEFPALDVLHLDTNSLVLSLTIDFAEIFEGEEIDFDQDGSPDTFVFNYTITFTK